MGYKQPLKEKAGQGSVFPSGCVFWEEQAVSAGEGCAPAGQPRIQGVGSFNMTQQLLQTPLSHLNMNKLNVIDNKSYY